MRHVRALRIQRLAVGTYGMRNLGVRGRKRGNVLRGADLLLTVATPHVSWSLTLHASHATPTSWYYRIVAWLPTEVFENGHCVELAHCRGMALLCDKKAKLKTAVIRLSQMVREIAPPFPLECV